MGLRACALVALGAMAAPARADVPRAAAHQAADDEPVLAPPRSYTPLPSASHEDSEPPPLGAGRFLGEVALGGVFAVGGLVTGALLGAKMDADDGCDGDLCAFGALAGGAAGLALVTPLGVYLVGAAGDQTGSFGATVGGSVLGTLTGVAVAEGVGGDAAVIALFGGSVAGAMIGFNLTREYDPDRAMPSWAPVASTAHGTTSFGIAGTF